MIGDNKAVESTEMQDPVILRAREKAKNLGLSPLWGEILCADSEEEANRRGQKLGVMGEVAQGAMYVMKAIYPLEAIVREASRLELLPVVEGWGLPDDIIENYLTKYGEYPDIKFEFLYGKGSGFKPKEIDRDKQMILRNAAREFFLTAARKYFQS